jgi:hypothetical protein
MVYDKKTHCTIDTGKRKSLLIIPQGLNTVNSKKNNALE